MKMLSILFATLLIVLPLHGEESVETREFKSKIFEVHNRAPNEIVGAVRLLGSGFKGSGISMNEELRTITVRDFPENIATIEEAIKRLDQVEAAPIITLNVSVLIGSKTPVPTADPIPEDLSRVVKVMSKMLRYSHFGLLTSIVHRTKPGAGVQGSGVMDSLLIRTTTTGAKSIPYSYNVSGVTTSGNVTNVNRFQFNMRMPFRMNASEVEYRNIGFETPVSIRQNEKVVIGNAVMGDRALIVVLTATVEAP
jgi:hypothetical protein